jgi:hypothetical protein
MVRGPADGGVPNFRVVTTLHVVLGELHDLHLIVTLHSNPDQGSVEFAYQHPSHPVIL